MKKIINTCIGICFAISAFSQAGELDLSFNGDGIFTQGFNSQSRARSMALQADGKIIIGGYLVNGDRDLLLMRLDEYGNPDLTFGTQGYTTTDFRGDDDEVSAIAVTPAGQIITLAESDSANITGALFTRFTSFGQVDFSFGNQGHLFVYAPSNSVSNTWNDMIMLADGSLIAVGRINGTGVNRGGMLKITPQGQIDQTFGTNGLVMLDNNGLAVNLIDIALAPNGDYFVLGSTTLQGDLSFYIAKFNPDGNPISSFGGNGSVVFTMPGAPFPSHLLVKPDGKLFITGTAYINGWSQIINYQLLSSGLLDQTFGTNGRSETQILTGHANAAASALLPDGKLMLTGNADGPWNEDFALARLQPNGNLDLSFHFDGFVTKNIGGGTDYVVDAALQLDGRIVLVGNSASSSNNLISVARFLTGYSSAIEINEEEKINLVAYPNPCNQWLKVKAPPSFQVLKASLYSLRGERIWQKMINPQEALNTAELANGMYVLTLQTSSGDIQHLKITISH